MQNFLHGIYFLFSSKPFKRLFYFLFNSVVRRLIIPSSRKLIGKILLFNIMAFVIVGIFIAYAVVKLFCSAVMCVLQMIWN